MAKDWIFKKEVKKYLNDHCLELIKINKSLQFLKKFQQNKDEKWFNNFLLLTDYFEMKEKKFIEFCCNNGFIE